MSTKINESANDLLKKRYYREGESTWEALCRRVCEGVANAEQTQDKKQFWHDKFYEIMSSLDFVPSTPCLINADKTNKGQLSSCFIIDMRDTIESIYAAKGKCAKIFQKNGGVGFNLSVLRPQLAEVETSGGKSCGVLGFMEEFNLTADIITRNNIRKGAMKIDLNDWHPEILEFIKCKDLTDKFNFMNISVSISDKFMRAVINDEDWQLKFPDYRNERESYEVEWSGDIDEWIERGHKVVIYETIRARDLWCGIMEHAWQTGEPGVSFRDVMNRDNPNPHLGKINATNPCFTGDMKLLTANGYKTFEELDGQTVDIRNIDGEVSNGKVWCNGEKETVRLVLNDDSFITCTPEHRFMSINGDEVQAKNSKGKKLYPNTKIAYCPDKEYVKLGFIQGDGQLNRLNSINHKGLEINIGEKDSDIAELFGIKGAYDRHVYINGYNETLKALGFSQETLSTRIFPLSYDTWDLNAKASFLQGCYSANGCVIKDTRVSYKTICADFADKLKETLANDFGIESYITINKAHKVKFSNGEYLCKESYDVNIHKYQGLLTFCANINFYQAYKRIKLENLLKTRALCVRAVCQNEVCKVYDFSEPLRHWGIVNGIIAHNCAEFCSIPYNSCNLGSVNLANFVDTDGQFQTDRFVQCVKTAFRFLDNMITVNKLPLTEIEEVTKSLRSVGLGTMGLADCLYKMKIQYGSPQCMDFLHETYSLIKSICTSTSEALREEKGAYPASVNGMRRNSNFLSIAPNGSISFICNTSGGIEPNFALLYQRRTNEGDTYYVINPVFEEELKRRGLLNDGVLKKIADNHGSCLGIGDIPEDMQRVFVTASDIPPQIHVDVLVTVQQYVDLAVSKTVNLPNTATVKDVADAYMQAWQGNCKGITVYRDGSRQNQTLNAGAEIADKDKYTIVQLERGMIEEVPTQLEYRKYKIRSGCGRLYLFVGIDENEGRIYDFFTNTDGVGGCTVSTQAISRLMSTCIRGGVPVEYVIEQLQKSGSCPSYQYSRGKGESLNKGRSCASAIAYILTDIMKELSDDDNMDDPESNTCAPAATAKEVINVDVCPECGSQLQHINSCVSCASCGWSRCN